MGPLGNDRQDVFSTEVNALIDRIDEERNPKARLEVAQQKFRGEVRRLHEKLSQGIVLVLIPEN
jgi:predicted nuclease with TOPRIM domain